MTEQSSDLPPTQPSTEPTSSNVSPQQITEPTQEMIDRAPEILAPNMAQRWSERNPKWKQLFDDLEKAPTEGLDSQKLVMSTFKAGSGFEPRSPMFAFTHIAGVINRVERQPRESLKAMLVRDDKEYLMQELESIKSMPSNYNPGDLERVEQTLQRLEGLFPEYLSENPTNPSESTEK